MKRLFSSFRSGALAIGSLFLLGVAVTSCNKNNNDNNNDIPVAGLLAANLAPDVNQTAITLSGNSISNGPLAFGSYTGYLGIYTGSRQVSAFDYSSGSSLNADTTFNFEADKYYSLFLVGSASNYQTVVVHDNIDSLDAVAGKAYVRYVNAIPDASNQSVTIASGGSNVVNDNAAFASVSEFTAINAGDIVINATNGGSVNVNRTINVEERKLYTIFLQGAPGGTGNQAVQIKFITNGTLDASTGKQGTVSAKSSN